MQAKIVSRTDCVRWPQNDRIEQLKWETAVERRWFGNRTGPIDPLSHQNTLP